jgi:hypothetical protein
MTDTQRHLAQLNIGRLRYPLEDPRIADFVANLDRINAIADRSEGFVWRLQGDDGNATSVAAFDDPRIIVNMSVWTGAEALERYVWQTVHKRVYGRRQEWFEKMQEAHLVLWWVPAGHRPTVAEALERLAHLRAHGSSDQAFSWSALPSAQLWKEARCA